MKKKKVIKLKGEFLPQTSYSISKNELLKNIFMEHNENVVTEESESKDSRLIINCINKLLKKNMQTKLKAVYELIEILNESQDQSISNSFSSFLSVYNYLIYHINSTLRENLNICLKLFIQKIKTKIKKHLNSFIPHLFITLFDVNKNVKKISSEILSEMFPVKNIEDIKKEKTEREKLKIDVDSKIYLTIKNLNINIINFYNCLKYIKNDFEKWILNNLKNINNEELDINLYLANSICFFPCFLYIIIKYVKLTNKLNNENKKNDENKENKENKENVENKKNNEILEEKIEVNELDEKRDKILEDKKEIIKEKIISEFITYKDLYNSFFQMIFNIYKEHKNNIKIKKTLFKSIYNIIYLLKKNKINFVEFNYTESNLSIFNYICCVINNKDEYIFKNINHLLLLYFYSDNKQMIKENFLRSYLSLVKQNKIYECDFFNFNMSLFIFLFEKENIAKNFFFFFFLFYFLLINDRQSTIIIYYDLLLHLFEHFPPILKTEKKNFRSKIKKKLKNQKNSNNIDKIDINEKDLIKEKNDESEEINNSKEKEQNNLKNNAADSEKKMHIFTDYECSIVLCDNILTLPIELFFQRKLISKNYCFKNENLLNILSNEYYCNKKKKKKNDIKETNKFLELRKKLFEITINETDFLITYINFIKSSNVNKAIILKSLDILNVYVTYINIKLRKDELMEYSDDQIIENDDYYKVLNFILNFLIELKLLLFYNNINNIQSDNTYANKRIRCILNIFNSDNSDYTINTQLSTSTIRRKKIKKKINMKRAIKSYSCNAGRCIKRHFIKVLQITMNNLFLLVDTKNYEFIQLFKNSVDLLKLYIDEKHSENNNISSVIFNVFKDLLDNKEIKDQFFNTLWICLELLKFFCHNKYTEYNELNKSFIKHLFNESILNKENIAHSLNVIVELINFMQTNEIVFYNMEAIILKIYKHYIIKNYNEDLLNNFYDIILKKNSTKLLFNTNFYFNLFYIYIIKIKFLHTLPSDSFSNFFFKFIKENTSVNILLKNNEKLYDVYLFCLFIIYFKNNSSEYEILFFELKKDIIFDYLNLLKQLFYCSSFKCLDENEEIKDNFSLNGINKFKLENSKCNCKITNNNCNVFFFVKNSNLTFEITYLNESNEIKKKHNICQKEDLKEIEKKCKTSIRWIINKKKILTSSYILKLLSIYKIYYNIERITFQNIKKITFFCFNKNLIVYDRVAMNDESMKILNSSENLKSNEIETNNEFFYFIYSNIDCRKLFLLLSTLNNELENKSKQLNLFFVIYKYINKNEIDLLNEIETSDIIYILIKINTEDIYKMCTILLKDRIKKDKSNMKFIIEELKKIELNNLFQLKIKKFFFKCYVKYILKDEICYMNSNQLDKNDVEYRTDEIKNNHDNIKDNYMYTLDLIKLNVQKDLHNYIDINFNLNINDELSYLNLLYHLIYISRYTNLNLFSGEKVQDILIKSVHLTINNFDIFFYCLFFIKLDHFFDNNTEVLEVIFENNLQFLQVYYKKIYEEEIVYYIDEIKKMNLILCNKDINENKENYKNLFLKKKEKLKYGLHFINLTVNLIENKLFSNFLNEKDIIQNFIKISYFIISLSDCYNNVKIKLKNSCIKLIQNFFDLDIKYFNSLSKLYILSLKSSIYNFNEYFIKNFFFMNNLNTFNFKVLIKIKKIILQVYINTYFLFILFSNIKKFKNNEIFIEKTLDILKINSIMFNELHQIKKEDTEKFNLLTDYMNILTNTKKYNFFLNSFISNNDNYEQIVLESYQYLNDYNYEDKKENSENISLTNDKDNESDISFEIIDPKEEQEENEEEENYDMDDEIDEEYDNVNENYDENNENGDDDDDDDNNNNNEKQNDTEFIKEKIRKEIGEKKKMINAKNNGINILHLLKKHLNNPFLLINLNKNILRLYNFLTKNSYLELLLSMLNICLSSEYFIYTTELHHNIISFIEKHNINFYNFLNDIHKINNLINDDKNLNNNKKEVYIFFFSLYLILILITMYPNDCVTIVNEKKLFDILSFNEYLFSNLIITYQLDQLKKISKNANTNFFYDSNLKILYFNYIVKDEEIENINYDNFTAKLILNFLPNYPFSHLIISDKIESIDKKAYIHNIIKSMYKYARNGNINEIFLRFNNTMDKYFQNKENCNICFMFLHEKKTCDKICANCKTSYHSKCLHKWFLTSHNTKCPSCQVQFNT